MNRHVDVPVLHQHRKEPSVKDQSRGGDILVKECRIPVTLSQDAPIACIDILNWRVTPNPSIVAIT
jgi:hypothetical protein